VLNFGKILTEGKPQAVRNHPEVIAAYLGGEVKDDDATEPDDDKDEEETAGVTA